MNEQGARLLAGIREHRGYVLPMHEALAERHPEFLAGYDAMFRAAMSQDSALEPKVRELIVMVLDVAMGVSEKAVRGHARKAMQHGASEAEVLAAIELATLVFAGKPLGMAARVFAEDEPAGS